ncbi:hypothetical protein WJM97_15475 [Okeanomitos corallinicola TIOX110]|uniref:ATPase n=1 Tax=Okeanomitos corallinicola TIOX110 TaxID=3133117 RepID=A0ABZ2UNS9_9CYAN
MDSIDKLLAEIQAEHTEAKKNIHRPQNPTANTAKPLINSVSKSDALIDNLLAEVKADFVERDATEELRKQQELEQEKNRQAQIKVQQREALKKQAQAWIDKLDPLSSEGIWFESFAKAYPSKLAAAIEYLQNN